MKINKNLLVLVFSSILNVSIALIIGFLIPEQLDYSSFSSYKIYVFYLTFVPFFHIGIVDGFFLFFSKVKINFSYNNVFFNFFIRFLIFQFLIATFFFLLSFYYFEVGLEYYLVIFMIPFANLSTLISKYLAILEKFYVYALFSLINRTSILLSTILLIIFSSSNFLFLVLAHFVSYLIQIIWGLILIYRKGLNFNPIKSNHFRLMNFIRIGLPNLIFYILFSFLIGIDRIFLEYYSDVYTYAMYSFAYSIITIALTILESTNVFIFTRFLRSTSPQQFYYNKNFRLVLHFFFLMASVIIVLIDPLINFFIPKYVDSIKYILALYPIIFLKIQFSLRIWPNLNKTTINHNIIFKLIFSISISLCLFAIFFQIFGINMIPTAAVFSLIIFNLIMEKKRNSNKLIIYDLLWSLNVIVFTISSFLNYFERYLVILPVVIIVSFFLFIPIYKENFKKTN